MKTRHVVLALVAAIAVTPPARAQWIVFDPSNYAQSVLTAARELQQVNNEIQSLQNEAVMLENQARNLQHLDYSSLAQMTSALDRIGTLMSQGQGISFNLAQTEAQWQAQYPTSYGPAVTSSGLAHDAEARWRDTMAAFQNTMQVQSGIVGNVQADQALLSDLVSQSQGAEGALQASQATNQLIALSAKQQMQIETLMAAQYRAQAQDQARKAQSEEASRAATVRFLGSGTAYTP